MEFIETNNTLHIALNIPLVNCIRSLCSWQMLSVSQVQF